MKKVRVHLVVLSAIALLAAMALSRCAAAPGPRSRPTPESMNAGQSAQSSSVSYKGLDGSLQTVQVRYLLYLPEAYGQDPQRRWPLILFLHGWGERGNDLNLLKKHPLPRILATSRDFPFIVVSPQLSLEMDSWSLMIEPLNALLDWIQDRYSTDQSRVYLTGLSMGGCGTWEFGLRHPKRFAALAPIAGWFLLGSRTVPFRICDLKDVPIWAFHGARDMSIEPWQSEVLVEALRACGSDIRFTLYEDADHEASWRRAYADPEFYAWLLSHARTP